ncbi:MAG: DUF968 domain-containing protein [Pseudomonadota bacterium]
MNRLKQKVWRDKSYGKWIHENVSCCITGDTTTVDPHHIKGEGYGTIKAPDYMQMALAHHLHNEIHVIGYEAFEAKYGRTQRSMVAETLVKAHSMGRINMEELPLEAWIWEEVEELVHVI